MADMKRPNVATKVPVATPNIGPSGMVSLETALSGVIGARVRITTTLSSTSTIEGTVFVACPLTNLVALSVSPFTKFCVLPISSIQNFVLLSLPTPTAPTTLASPAVPMPFSNALPALAPISTNAVISRANGVIARLKEAESRKGKGVGKEAQDIFDGLARTMPTRWDGTNIVVMDVVAIGSPYRVEDCKAAGQGGVQLNVLARVKKVLENERKRLVDRSKPAIPAAVPFVGPRKGG